MDLFRDSQIDFMKYRKFWIIFSLVLVVVGIFSIFVHGKLNVGIDFAGGTQLTLRFQERPDVEELRSVLAGAGMADAQIQRFGEEGDNEVIVKTPLIEGSEEGSRDRVVEVLETRYGGEGAAGTPDLNRIGVDQVASVLMAADPESVVAAEGEEAARARYEAAADAILEVRREEGLIESWEKLSGAPGVTAGMVGALQERTHLGSFSVLGVESVGPAIGQELRRRGILAVVLSMLGMLAYIWIRFELRFGIGALMATLHDVLVCLGLYALAGFELNLTTIAAFLTLVGYSVNDTVVVFDRVRENMRKTRREPLITIMNRSINQTLSRTVLTSGTTLLAVGSLLVLGGDVIRGFAFVLTIGIVVGTYSSIYIASPFALLWDQLFGSQARQRKSTPRAA